MNDDNDINELVAKFILYKIPKKYNGWLNFPPVKLKFTKEKDYSLPDDLFEI